MRLWTVLIKFYLIFVTISDSFPPQTLCSSIRRVVLFAGYEDAAGESGSGGGGGGGDGVEEHCRRTAGTLKGLLSLIQR